MPAKQGRGGPFSGAKEGVEEGSNKKKLVKVLDLGNLGTLSSDTFDVCTSYAAEANVDHLKVCFVDDICVELRGVVFAATDQINASTCTPIYVGGQGERYQLKCTSAESGNVVWLVHDSELGEVCWYSEEMDPSLHRVCRFCPFACPCTYGKIRLFDGEDTQSVVTSAAHLRRGASLPVVPAPLSEEKDDDKLRGLLRTMLGIRVPLEAQINELFAEHGKAPLFEHRCTLDALVDRTLVEIRSGQEESKGAGRVSSLMQMDAETMEDMQGMMRAIVDGSRSDEWRLLKRAVEERLQIAPELEWFEFVKRGAEEGELERFREHVQAFFIRVFSVCDRLLVFGEDVLDTSNLLWHISSLMRELVVVRHSSSAVGGSSIRDRMREKLERKRRAAAADSSGKDEEKKAAAPNAEQESSSSSGKEETSSEEEENTSKKKADRDNNKKDNNKYKRKKKRAEMKKEAAARAAAAPVLQARVRRLMIAVVEKAKATARYELRVMARAEAFREEECAVCFKRFDCYAVLPWRSHCSNMLVCTSCLEAYKPASCLCGKSHFDRRMWFLAF